MLILFALCPLLSSGQVDSSRWQFGMEQDILPYATGGYFAAVWVGKEHVRVRALVARVRKPDIVVRKGFTNNRVTAYALILDYFKEKDWKGWWLGGGLVYWKSSVQADTRQTTAYYDNTLLNGSIGYNWYLTRKIYLSPWVGIHVRVGGTKEILVDNQVFRTSFLNPEGSLKMGLHF